ncbi:MAG: bifunctional diaminohydroxyphosphoribosylaminopyrimidine deaminase/5-amino-6-(5-phosphoribosylamino)uracil reductase RibD [Mesonia sp.]|uniref:bifunctional diaminohydroxyphosphoribosylaminopyrimidine deaminase/5-amino-6-(5-phosphoribosylamino)uracil reductase RibD n=1 Tax=Mesonia sp. TaxID=1960830 RepID=UPI003F99196D
MKIHEKYIKRCIQLAKNGLGTTYPNPLVGSVIVYKDRIIGEGWHQKAGEAHAEVRAIHQVKDASLLKKATIYVSLEPCSHFGKTAPCSDLIIANGIKKVVIGTIDPFAKVAGKGIQKLIQAGCDVVVGVLENECQELNKRFFTFHQKKRPYLILKWAQTKNGFMAPKTQNLRESVWISNRYNKQLVHKWRSEEQAILIGTQTALKDNPQLNTRLWKGKSPLRLVIDKNLSIPKDSKLYNAEVRTIFLTEKEAGNSENIEFKTLDFSQNIIPQLCDYLYKLGVQSVIVEGGGKTLEAFIALGYWDEARVTQNEAKWKEGVLAPVLEGNITKEIKLQDNLVRYYEPK